MKLCIIGNPNSIHTRRWVDWFKERGHTVWLIADVKPVKRWNPIADFVLPGRFSLPVLKFLLWGIKCQSVIRKLQPDIVHAHRVSSAGWIGAFSGFHPFVVTPWGSDLYQHPSRSRIAAWLAGYVLSRADMVTASSHDLCERARAFGANLEKTHLVGWGVDLSLFNPDHLSNQEARTSNAPAILNLRAVKPIYNLDVILKAIPIVRNIYPDAVFIFQQYNIDLRYKQHLVEMVNKLDIRGNVQWLDEIDEWEQVLNAYRKATIAISIASTDSMPISIQEAMACGIPVIASDLASIREWITPSLNGLLVPPRDERALASAIIQLSSDPALVNSFRQHNFQLVGERGNHHNEMKKMESLYQNILEKSTK